MCVCVYLYLFIPHVLFKVYKNDDGKFQMGVFSTITVRSTVAKH